LRPQVVYRCPDAGEDPGSACIASPPSVVNADPECSGHGPGIQGRAGHFAVIACPQTTRTILAGTSTGVLLGRRDRPRTVRVNGRRLRSIAWTAWGAATARGHGRLGTHRRAVVLTRARPCDAVHRFAYTRVKVVGVAAARRGCPRSRPTATGAP
jgi:hypothetical protein